jgi:hypothetical protein
MEHRAFSRSRHGDERVFDKRKQASVAVRNLDSACLVEDRDLPRLTLQPRKQLERVTLDRVSIAITSERRKS